MTDYVVTEAQLEELNMLINKAGGENTSEMSTRHEQVVANANTLPDTVGTTRSKIIKLTEQAQGYNEVVGETLAQMQYWHDEIVYPDTGGPEPVPPGPAPGATPVTPVLIDAGANLYALPDYVPSSGNCTFVADVGKRYTFRLAGEGSNTSYSCPQGPCNCAAGATPGATDIAGQPGNDNAIILGKLPAGTYFTFWLEPGHSPQGTVLYSAQHYGG